MSDSDSGDEVEVIEVKAANSLVPNLTISVEKDDEEPTVEFLDEEKGDKVDGSDIEVKVGTYRMPRLTNNNQAWSKMHTA